MEHGGRLRDELRIANGGWDRPSDGATQQPVKADERGSLGDFGRAVRVGACSLLEKSSDAEGAEVVNLLEMAACRPP